MKIEADIGHGIFIKYSYGCGVGQIKCGDNITLPHNITFATERNKSPEIGNNVRFYPGVVVIGGVKVGDNCIVKPNCVITKDVPDNHIAEGVPNVNIPY